MNRDTAKSRLNGFVGIRPDGKRMYFYNTHDKPEPLLFAVFEREVPCIFDPARREYVQDESKPCGPWRRVALLADKVYHKERTYNFEQRAWLPPARDLTPREMAEQVAIWWRVVGSSGYRGHEAQVVELRPVQASPTRVGSGVNPR